MNLEVHVNHSFHMSGAILIVWHTTAGFVSYTDIWIVLYMYMYLSLIIFDHIDTNEIPGFLLSLKNHISPHKVNISFLSFTCENIGVVMVTKTISQ